MKKWLVFEVRSKVAYSLTGENIEIEDYLDRLSEDGIAEVVNAEIVDAGVGGPDLAFPVSKEEQS